MELNYNANRNYFMYQKPSSFLHRFGITFSGIAIILFFTAFTTVAALCGIGAVCFLLVSEEINESDDEIESQIIRETDRLCNELEEKHWDLKNPFPRMIVSSVGDFVTDESGLRFRRAKDRGKTFTSRYSVVAIGLKKQRLYFAGERYSLIDENDFSATEGEYDFTELDRADYREAEGATIPHAEFAIYLKNGEEVFRVPAPFDYTTEKYAEDLSAVFAHAAAETTEYPEKQKKRE